MYNEIKNKLKKGYSIDEICSEFNLTFTEVTELMRDNKNDNEKNYPKSSTNHVYISRSREKFKIRKCNVNFGTYASLEDAIKVRDYLIENGWNVDELDEICSTLGVVRCQKNYTHIREKNGHFYLMGSEDGEYKLFGAYHSFDDAVRMREHCKKHGWKRKCVDEYCEILGIKRIKGVYELKSKESLYA